MGMEMEGGTNTCKGMLLEERGWKREKKSGEIQIPASQVRSI